MPKPPKLSLAAIVAAAAPPPKAASRAASKVGSKVAAEAYTQARPETPPKARAKALPRPAALPAARRASGLAGGAGLPASAEIVPLDLSGPRRGGHTLKERARQMSVYLEPPVYDQLRDLAHAERTKMHGLMLEALDLLFRQRGARSIDQLTDPDGR